MNYVHLISIIIIYSLFGLFSAIYSRHYKDKTNTVKVPRFVFFILLFGIALFVLFTILAIVSGEKSPFVYIIFGIIIMIGVYGIYGSLVFRIKYSNTTDYFEYRLFYGKSIKVYYKDCKSYNDKKGIKITTIQGKKYGMDFPFLINLYEFVYLLNINKVSKETDKKANPK